MGKLSATLLAAKHNNVSYLGCRSLLRTCGGTGALLVARALIAALFLACIPPSAEAVDSGSVVVMCWVGFDAVHRNHPNTWPEHLSQVWKSSLDECVGPGNEWDVYVLASGGSVKPVMRRWLTGGLANTVAGVVVTGDELFDNADTPLKSVFPLRNRPPLLVMAGSGEGALAFRIRDQALALRGAGFDLRWVLLPTAGGVTQEVLSETNTPGFSLLRDFLGIAPAPEWIRFMADALDYWLNPPYSTLGFWDRYPSLIRRYPVDDRLRAELRRVLEKETYQVDVLPLEHFFAIPLADLLDQLPGTGDYLVTENIRGEKFYWSVEDIRRFRGVIVVGLDDERELFRYGVFYRLKREYSWADTLRSPWLFRPLGAFVHFLDPPPERLHLSYQAGFAITANGLGLMADDPLHDLGPLPEGMRAMLLQDNGCVACHTLRGLGARSHHVRADDGRACGGYALPLEQYSADVWYRFVYHQAEVAESFGVNPNVVQEDLREGLYELIVNARQQNQEKD